MFNGSKGEISTRLGDSKEVPLIATSPGFATGEACETLIELCERQGFDVRESSYRQSTSDLQVDRSPLVLEFLRRHLLVEEVSSVFKRLHLKRTRIFAFDDVFVVKYDASKGNQKDLIKHYDAGNMSFMVALSRSSTYSGGGTKFFMNSEKQPVVEMEQGTIMVFPSSIYHSGLPISSGSRYLLVGFCYTDHPASCRVPGNVGTNLKTIVGNVSRFDLAQLVGHTRSVFSKIMLKPSRRLVGGKSYFVNSTCTAPKDPVTAFALGIFRFHVGRLGLPIKDPAQAGAEFWVQDLEGDEEIPFHCDKDELLLQNTGRLRHPILSTVTYLTNGGLPTAVFGEETTCISYPQIGNHLSFAGKLLHGVASSLACSTPNSLKHKSKKCRINRRRTTLLVNLWTKGPPTLVDGGPSLPPTDTILDTEVAVFSNISMKPAYWQEVHVPRATSSDPRDVIQQNLSNMDHTCSNAFLLVKSASA